MHSQTGPAGVETSTDNVLWLKADQGTFNNAGTTPSTAGGAIQQWNDQSGNSKHAIQLTAGFKPTWQTNAMNGFPAVRFDGNDDGILSAAVTTSGTVTFFAVVRSSALSKTNPGILQGSPTGLGYSVNPPDKSIGMWVNTATQRIWGRGIQTSTAQRNITQVTALATNTAYIATNRYDGANINQYVNNTISGTVTYDGTLRSWTDIAIGTQGTETWNGDIAEIIVYKKSLNEAQRHIVDNYLSAKYNITLASNNKYNGDNTGNGDYDRNVAGIGAEASGSNPTFSATATLGMGIVSKSGLGNGDYLLAGHAAASNSVITSDITGLSGTNPARWSRIWYIDVTNAGAVLQADVEFDMVAGGMSGTTPATHTNYKLLYRAGTSGAWTEVATANSISGTKIIFASYNFNNNADDGYYTIGTMNNAVSPLPIELLSFDAIMNNNQVDITWATATESNNDYYTIEKSKDGINFETSSIVDAAGNSLSLINYKDIDSNPYQGISYYRLKQTDFNGTFSYSKIVSVNYTLSDDGMSIFPNPTEGEININMKDLEGKEVLVVIRDITGKECFTKVIISQENQQLIAVDSEQKLAAGTYIVTASSSNKLYSKKIIVK
ncbi:MAG: T9SS type A sorting domain-containing protein [Bacteroidetes bacterium]|nr:T9SS type A sorting domain-containing protein [Bacteroidota bacterium]